MAGLAIEFASTGGFTAVGLATGVDGFVGAGLTLVGEVDFFVVGFVASVVIFFELVLVDGVGIGVDDSTLFFFVSSNFDDDGAFAEVVFDGSSFGAADGGGGVAVVGGGVGGVTFVGVAAL